MLSRDSTTKPENSIGYQKKTKRFQVSCPLSRETIEAIYSTYADQIKINFNNNSEHSDPETSQGSTCKSNSGTYFVN